MFHLTHDTPPSLVPEISGESYFINPDKSTSKAKPSGICFGL
jgi:hypothetical protein